MIKDGIIEISSILGENVEAYVTTKERGNLSETYDHDGTAIQNLDLLVDDLNIDIVNKIAVILPLTHSNHVAELTLTNRRGFQEVRKGDSEIVRINSNNPEREVFTKEQRRKTEIGYDAAITNNKNVYLCMLSADCAPVMLYDPVKQVIALAHCGFAGTMSSLVKNTLDSMKEWYGSSTENISAYIGPCVSKEKYKIVESGYWKAGLKDHFSEEWADNFSLVESITQQLIKCGVDSGEITSSPYCTSIDSDKFFSYSRVRLNGDASKEGRFLSIIGLR